MVRLLDKLTHGIGKHCLFQRAPISVFLTYIGRLTTYVACELLEDRWKAARSLMARPMCFQFGKFRMNAELNFPLLTDLRTWLNCDIRPIAKSEQPSRVPWIAFSVGFVLWLHRSEVLKRVVASNNITLLFSRLTVCSLGSSANSIPAPKHGELTKFYQQ